MNSINKIKYELFRIFFILFNMKVINKDIEIYIKDNLIHIKNYNKVIDISNNKIELKDVVINGTNLIISKLDEYELCIKGKFKGIIFND